MSTFVISDLSFLEELDNQESKIAGATSTSTSFSSTSDTYGKVDAYVFTSGKNAFAASSSTTNGKGFTLAKGDHHKLSKYINTYFNRIHSRPSISIDLSDLFHYY